MTYPTYPRDHRRCRTGDRPRRASDSRSVPIQRCPGSAESSSRPRLAGWKSLPRTVFGWPGAGGSHRRWSAGAGAGSRRASSTRYARGSTQSPTVTLTVTGTELMVDMPVTGSPARRDRRVPRLPAAARRVEPMQAARHRSLVDVAALRATLAPDVAPQHTGNMPPSPWPSSRCIPIVGYGWSNRLAGTPTTPTRSR